MNNKEFKQKSEELLKANPITTKETFFQNIINKEFILIGAFRNEMHELFCLFKKKENTKLEILYIVGDETDWEERIFNPSTATIGDFILSPNERFMLLQLASLPIKPKFQP